MPIVKPKNLPLQKHLSISCYDCHCFFLSSRNNKNITFDNFILFIYYYNTFSKIPTTKNYYLKTTNLSRYKLLKIERKIN